MKKKNILCDIFRITYESDYGTMTKYIEAWSESDAIATLTKEDKVYYIEHIVRVA